MSTTITYKGSILRTIVGGQTATLNCKDKKMLSNVVVSFGEAGTITYDGKVTPVSANKKATLICANQKMLSNVIIYANSEVADDGTGLYDANDNLVASWNTLVNTYGMDCTKTYTISTYSSDPQSPYNVLKKTELSNGVKLIIPNSIISIGEYAFYACTSLINVQTGNSVLSIGNYAFSNCTSLTSVTIGNSITSIGDRAFSGCSGLKGVYITDLTAWCNIVFGHLESNPVYFAKNLYLNNEIVKNLVIPNTITEIKSYAFAYCSALKSITIPDSVSSIGYAAFWGCTNSTTVTIGNSVKSIGENAFAYNYQLTTVTINAINPPTLASTCFNGNKKLTTIYVPDIAVDTYKGWTNWSAYEEKIKPLSEKE